MGTITHSDQTETVVVKRPYDSVELRNCSVRGISFEF